MEVLKQYVLPLEDADVDKAVNKMASDNKLSKLEAAILYNRGVRTNKDVAECLHITLDNLIDPRLLKDGYAAANVIVDAIKNGEKIALYTDYDCDGWGAAVVGYEMLKNLGADMFIYANTRNMGYGMNRDGVDQIMKSHPDTKLILTADNGIVAFDAVDYANSLGLKVVITDHHQPDMSGRYPNALANVNPHRPDEEYPYHELCGAGVLWKVLQICYYIMGIPAKRANELLDVVAVSTVADVVPITGENRIIVSEGLKMVTNNSRPQWRILKDVFSDYNKIEVVDTRTVGFSFGPAINAISRMRGDIRLAIKAFVINNEDEIRKIAVELKTVNKERKAITEDQTNAAMGQAELQSDLPIVIINSEEFFDGVVGLVAGRIREAINKPTIVMTKEGNVWKGSGRSIPGYHIKDALDEVQAATGLMVTYGGHSQACGVSVTDENMIDFRLAMQENADKIPAEAFIRKVVVDYEADATEIDNGFFDKIKNLAPYGNSFEEPIIGIQNLVPTEVKTIGADNQHLVLKCGNFDVVSWYGATAIKDGVPASFTVCGRLERDNFGVKLMVDPSDIH